MNDYHMTGFYIINTAASNVAHCPAGYSALIVVGMSATGLSQQICFNNSGLFYRAYTGNPQAWTTWNRLVGTAVS